MKFRIRPGFKLFADPGQAIDYLTRGATSGIKPRAQEGDVVDLTLDELVPMRYRGELGRLDPVDAEAREYYGDTQPAVSRLITHPELFARPAPEPPRNGADWRYA